MIFLFLGLNNPISALLAFTDNLLALIQSTVKTKSLLICLLFFLSDPSMRSRFVSSAKWYIINSQCMQESGKVQYWLTQIFFIFWYDVGTARGHASKSRKKCNFMAFSYWNIQWCQKDHITFSTNSPLVLTDLNQIVTWPIRHQEIWSTKVQNFFMNTMFQGRYDLVPNNRKVFFQVCIFEIKSSSYVTSC